MAIDTKTIQVYSWKILRFSMRICYEFVSAHPIFSSVSLFFILLFMFSPSFLAFIIYSLLILISAYGLYRVFYSGGDASSDIVKSYKKNDGDPSNMGKNGSISDEVKSKNGEKYMQKSCIQEKDMVCSARSYDDKVDKSANVENDVKDIKDVKEVKVDSGADAAEFSSCKADVGCDEDDVKDVKEVKVDSGADAAECSSSKADVGCDEGSKVYSCRKGGSEASKDSQEERLEDEQKNVVEPEDADTERNKRLENMIARRKARDIFRFQVRHTLMRRGKNDPVEHLASILVPRNKLLVPSHVNEQVSPGSAPSVLLPMHNPFDIPYETHEERPNLTDESFRREFLTEQRDLGLCRSASFSWGAVFSLDAMEDEDGVVRNDTSFKPRAPQKLKISVPMESHLELENESCREKEATSSGCSAEDHATREGQAAQQGPDSADSHHKKDKGETENFGVPDSVDRHHKDDKGDKQKDKTVVGNIGVGSSSSSSSEEGLPISKPNKEAILRSLLSFQRNAAPSKDDDEMQVNGFTNDTDQTTSHHIKSDDSFLYATRVLNNHPRSSSLASDMLVEVSEVSSPRSISSVDEEYSENEEVKEGSSHLSQVGTSDESNSREGPEISDQQHISREVSRINQEAASDVLAEKVFEENSINSTDSLSSLRTEMPDSAQTHSLNSNIEGLLESDSSEKNIGDITMSNVSDSKTPTNDNLEESDTANKMDNDIPESSDGSNSNSVNHQDLSESSLQNQQQENKEKFKDENKESESQPSQNSLSDNSTYVQSNHSSRSPENRRDEDVVAEPELPASSPENEASGVVSETETPQVPNISSSGSSPKSVLQPKFSCDNVSSLDLNQGTSTEHQQPHNEIVDDDSVLPVLNVNHSAFENVSPRQDDSTSQTSHAIDRLQSPRFADALYCVPFRSTPEECQNHDASITTSTSKVDQEIHDPYPHQSNFNQEAGTSNHIDNSVVNDNQERTNRESVENIEGDNHNESLIKTENAAVSIEPSSSKSIQDTEEGNKEIDRQEGASGTTKSTEGNSESGDSYS